MSVVEDFWYSFFPMRYQRATLHFPLLADLAYRRLIDWYQLNGEGPPDDDAVIAAAIRFPLDVWLDVSPVVRTKWRAVDGRLVNEFAKRLLDTQQALSETRKRKAQAAAAKRWHGHGIGLNYHNNHATSMPQAPTSPIRQKTPRKPKNQNNNNARSNATAMPHAMLNDANKREVSIESSFGTPSEYSEPPQEPPRKAIPEMTAAEVIEARRRGTVKP